MTRETYTKSEIDLMHKPMHDKLDKILAQTIKTNGRVGRLEVWRGYITGGLAILSILLVPILIWSIIQMFSLSNIDEKISSALQQELNKYEVTIE